MSYPTTFDNATSCAAFVLSARGEVLWVNRRIESFTGLSADVLMGSGGEKAIHPEDRESTLQVLSEKTRSGESFDYQLRLRRRDSVYRRFHATAIPATDSTGRVLSWKIFLTYLGDDGAHASPAVDSPDRSDLDSFLSTAEELASIVHEISQPMTAVTANASAAIRFLSLNPPDISAATKALRYLQSHSRDVSDIVRYMQASFRGETPAFATVDLWKTIDYVSGVLAEKLRQTNIDLRTEIDPHLPALRGNEVQIRQLLLNLMRNAIESMETSHTQPKDLRVSVRHRDGAISIQVADQGSGFQGQTVQLPPRSSTKAGGMGLGLRICHRIVEVHNGTLSSEAGQPRGTVFTVTLPIDGGH